MFNSHMRCYVPRGGGWGGGVGLAGVEYSGFQMTGMIEILGLQTKPKKIPHPQIIPAELNDNYTRNRNISFE